jgi:hypothetical protein
VGFEPGYGNALSALGPDGVLCQLDAGGGRVLHQRVVSAPFSCTGAPKPTLRQIPSRAYVALPSERRIDELWLDDGLAPPSSFSAGVVPGKLLAVGIDRRTRNLGELSDVE